MGTSNFVKIRAEDIKRQLCDLGQVTFEITDACNLRCKYCGYGEFYSDYDKRDDCNMSVDKAIALLDYLADFWRSELNNSTEKRIYLSFYGGEPLLNVPFIEHVIDYAEKMNIPNREFIYSMTTNAILLDRYMDFLIKHEFSLLISLDGDKAENGYRVDSNGNDHFDKIVKNIHLLKDKYPDYFESNVDFNAVLHNKNSYERIYSFMKEEFGKIAGISPLNSSGIRDEMKELFKKTYRNPHESLMQSEHYEEIERDMFIKSGTYQSVANFLHQYSGYVYRDYNELLYGKKGDRVVPTDTCIPFSKRVFMTVNGKLLPCERIGHQFAMGQVTDDNQVKLDFDEIAKRHNEYLNKVSRQCKSCKIQKSCIQCVYNLDDICCSSSSVICHGYTDEAAFEKYVTSQMAFLESHPEDYYRIMEEVIGNNGEGQKTVSW